MGSGAAVERGGEPRVPHDRSGHRVRRLRRAIQVEQRIAASRRHLRARRCTDDTGARELQPVLGPARDGYGRLRQPGGDGWRGGLRLDGSQRRPSGLPERSQPQSIPRVGRRLQP